VFSWLSASIYVENSIYEDSIYERRIRYNEVRLLLKARVRAAHALALQVIPTIRQPVLNPYSQ